MGEEDEWRKGLWKRPEFSREISPFPTPRLPHSRRSHSPTLPSITSLEDLTHW